MRTMYGLCAKYGIETDGKTPRELWREIHEAEERKKTEAARRMGVEQEDDPDEDYSFGYRNGREIFIDRKIAERLKKDPEHLPLKNYEPSHGFIAGVKKGSPMTHKVADGNKVNPYYATDLCNGGYNANCAMCIAAYEARRRGYNVRALPFLHTDEQEQVCADFKSSFINAHYIYPPKGNLYSFLEKQIHNGERYAFNFSDGRSDYLHVVMLLKEQGRIMIYDPQSGEITQGEKAKAQIQKAKDVRLLRTDNLEFNPQIIDYIVRGY